MSRGATVLDAPRGARDPDDRLDRDQWGAREGVHGSVPAWRDAQSVLGGHTERISENAAPVKPLFGAAGYQFFCACRHI